MQALAGTTKKYICSYYLNDSSNVNTISKYPNTLENDLNELNLVDSSYIFKHLFLSNCSNFEKVYFHSSTFHKYMRFTFTIIINLILSLSILIKI